jgi:hypothetical protein
MMGDDDNEIKIADEDIVDMQIKDGADDTDIVDPVEIDPLIEEKELLVEEEEDPEAAEMFSLMYAEYDER